METGKRKNLGGLVVNGTLLLLVILWTIPTVGIFVSSFRQRDDIATSGWWSVLPHREWQAIKEIDPKEDKRGRRNHGWKARDLDRE
jgi:alpha-glucoside transport system permease protein